MDDGQAAGEVGLRQVAEVGPHLGGRQHTFIYNGAARKRHDVEVLVVYALLYLLADDVERAFQVLRVSGTGNEHLLDVRLRLAGALPQDVRVDWHGAEVHQRESFALHLFYNDAQDVFLLLGVFGQEDEPRAVFALFGYRDALQQNEFMRYLYHDAGSVAGLVVGPFGSAVLHVLQHSQGRVHQFVRFASVQVYNHAHAAGVVFVGCIVQSALSVACVPLSLSFCSVQMLLILHCCFRIYVFVCHIVSLCVQI